MNYATKVRVLRALHGISQIELGVITGLANFDLSKIETGKMLPSESWDRAIHTGLGWTPAVDAALDALEKAVAVPATEEAACQAK